MAITDKLITVAENTPKVHEAGRNSVLKQFPESLHGSAEGTTCFLTDISSIEPTLDIKLSSKNLFDLKAFLDESNWIADTNNPSAYRSFKLNLLPNTTYTFSQGDGAGSNPSGYALYALFSPTLYSNSAPDNQWIISSGNSARTNEKITFTTNSTGIHYINIYYDTGRLQRLAAYLSTARIEIEISRVKLIKSGKNLFNPQILLDEGGKPQDDGSIYFKDSNAISGITVFKALPDVKRITLSYDVKTLNDTDSSGTRFFIYYTDGTKQYVGNVRSKDKYTHISVSSDADKIFDRVEGDFGSTGNSTWLKNIQIEVGVSETDYMPYEEEEYVANADGTVEGVTSIYPTTVLTTDAGAIINCNYLEDINAPIVRLIERSMSEFIIPDGVGLIAKNVFFGYTYLEGVAIPHSVTSIGVGAFQSCTSLKSIEIPNSVTTMSYEVFRSCSALKTVIFEEGSPLTQIPNYAFIDCKALEKIKIPSEVTLIGTQAFKNCSKCLEYDFSELSNPPTLYTDVFEGINDDAKIIVPASLYNDFCYHTNLVPLVKFIVSIGQTKTYQPVTLEDIWLMDGGSYRYVTGVSVSLKAYYRINDGDAVEFDYYNPAFGGLRFTQMYDGDTGYIMNLDYDTTLSFYEPGTYEIWVENENTGEKYYRRIIEVAE